MINPTLYEQTPQAAFTIGPGPSWLMVLILVTLFFLIVVLGHKIFFESGEKPGRFG